MDFISGCLPVVVSQGISYTKSIRHHFAFDICSKLSILHIIFVRKSYLYPDHVCYL